MTEFERPAARAALLEIVDNQLRDGNPSEAQATPDRLIREGHSRDEARKMIAFALLVELNEMVRDSRTYDEPSYVARLRALPDSIPGPDADDED